MKQLTLIFIVCLTSSFVQGDQKSTTTEAESSGERIVAEWIAGNRNADLVRGKICWIIYDEVFHIQKESEGEFGFRDSRFGFLNVRPVTTTRISQRIADDGKPYKQQPDAPTHWRWYPGKTQLIVDADKFAEEFVLPSLTHGQAMMPDVNARFVSIDLSVDPMLQAVEDSTKSKGWYEMFGDSLAGFFATMDGPMAFRPGISHTRLLEEWSFELRHETDSHVQIRAKPLTALKALHAKYCDLQLQKRPLRLVAIRCSEPTGNTKSTMLFSDVEFQSAGWSQPDLSDYEILQHVGLHSQAIDPIQKQPFNAAKYWADRYWADEE